MTVSPLRRWLALFSAIGEATWLLRSLQVKLIKMAGGIARHARQIVFSPVEVAVHIDIFAASWSACCTPIAPFLWLPEIRDPIEKGTRPDFRTGLAS